MTTESVTETLVEESRHKRRRIAASLWPRARLAGEILYLQIERDHLFTQAAALTYKTLFSLLPIFVLSLLILSTISAGGGKSALDTAVRDMLFDQLGIGSFPLQDDAGNALKNADGTDMKLSALFERLIAGAKASITTKATGLIAFAVLLYGAISLMIVIEGTFNHIYGSGKSRSWPRRIMLYWCVLTLGPIGIATSIMLGRQAESAASVVKTDWMAWILAAVKFFSGFAISWLVVFLMYRLIPDTRVKWRYALFGSFLAAGSWIIGKLGFSFYMKNALKDNWYGSLALLPLFMLWIYLTWSVVLVGLEVTYMLQFWTLLKRRFFFLRGGGADSVMLSDLRWVLSLGVLIYRNFKDGKLTEINDASEALMIPNDVTRELMGALEKGGLVHCVREAGGGAFALARPAETITAHDLLAAARATVEIPKELVKSPTQRPMEAPYLAQLDEIESTWAKQRTLADLSVTA